MPIKTMKNWLPTVPKSLTGKKILSTSTRITQKNWPMAIGSPLGEDVLLLIDFTAQEKLSTFFDIRASIFTQDKIDPAKLVGKNVTIRLNIGPDKKRYFNGFVLEIISAPERKEYEGSYYDAYLLKIGPFPYFLDKTSNCRIFQDKTVPDIIKNVIEDRGYAALIKFQIDGKYPKREYCVQYEESDFAFVSRLMEEEGIYYFFEHGNGKHTWILIDDKSKHKPYIGYDRIPYLKTNRQDIQRIITFNSQYKVVTGSYTLTGYNHEFPDKDYYTTGKNITLPQDMQGLEIYETENFPSYNNGKQEGKPYIDCRLQEHGVSYEIYNGSTDAGGVIPGCTFTLTDHPQKELNKEYLIIWSSLTANQEGEFRYPIDFSAIPKNTQFRAPRITPRPIIIGPVSAIVVGPKDKKFYTDKYARIKIRFIWDRESEADEKASCWIRVGQMLAGNVWGSCVIPRPGMEVLVAFEGGNPDKPIVVGTVYNAKNLPPVTDKNDTETVLLKTWTEDDKPGTLIKVDDTKQEKKHLLNIVEPGNMITEVKNDHKTEVTDGDLFLTLVNGSLNYNIKKDKTVSLEGNARSYTKGNEEKIVEGGSNHRYGKDFNLTAEQNILWKVTKAFGVDTDAIEIKAGKIHIKGPIVIEGEVQIKGNTSVKGDFTADGMNVSLKGAGSFCVLNPGGASLKGPMAQINSGGNASSANVGPVKTPSTAVKPTEPKEDKEQDKKETDTAKKVEVKNATKRAVNKGKSPGLVKAG